MENSKKNLTIALIEDDEILSKSLGKELEDSGFNVEYAFDGEEGLKLLKSKNLDLILLDIVMPKLDGISVLKALKDDPKTKETPVIILTILDNSGRVVEAVKAGTFDYLVKTDWTLEDIVKKVKIKLGVE